MQRTPTIFFNSILIEIVISKISKLYKFVKYTCFIMRLSDGMLTWGMSLKTILLLAILLIPFVLSGLTLSQSVSMNDPGFKEHTASSVNSVLVAGGFRYFDVTLTDEAERICIIAYHGDLLPEPEDRSVSNYYRWEYDNGVWKDVSGHDLVYIKPSQCVKDNDTYSY